MQNPIVHKDFLLKTPTSRALYHDYAAQMPLFDYHCHLPVQEIAEDRQFENLTQLWLAGDHYKWRAMRTLGISETYITGSASDYEKFAHWAATVPATLRNPLYHWTHLELERAFGITDLLNAESARRIYDTVNELLQSGEYSVRKLIRKFNRTGGPVDTICTTDDPVDSLHWHRQLAASDFGVRVSTSWRPDKALAIGNPERFNAYVNQLEAASNQSISTFQEYLAALKTRHQYFHDNGCRLADHGLEVAFPVTSYSAVELENAFALVRSGRPVPVDAQQKFMSAMLHELAVWNFEKDWTQQFHVGALRDVNTKAVRTIGQACGFDSIADFTYADSMGQFFNTLEEAGTLTRTIIYNLNPRDNEVVASMIGNFQAGASQAGGTPGKMQFGSGWWFLDQKDGIQKQLNALSNLGLLSQFVGMVTDSRSFLSFTRHEYFRRILCDLLGTDIEAGEIPDDRSLVGNLVQDICFNNAKRYFNL